MRDVEKAVEKRIATTFDRPTPYTQRAVYVRPASKSKLYAEVGIKDRQARYLEIQETGGTRQPKGRAIVLPVGARLNKYGNMPKGAVGRALARKDTFSGRIGGVAGIWQRQRKGQPPKLLYAYENDATYQPVFRFQATADEVARTRLRSNISRAMATAILTAR